ncbi:GNAT family N-acetyltransferase [Flavobacterium aquicola]|uniref:Ribosomal protein S18 acetylase RimI-like enzyme n=1 Tax=Flavobacterium aquicola TaxID=1682742 RepID=A0A3E0EU21_9FLAO|nr:GNAT family N-acetyltransferase [Flavobacterium aquicola]REH01171.1 ribosomal protein S18 acetylase RimI-like enzyme [Flavobacterium aquicola]
MTRKANIQDLDQLTNLFDQYVVFYKNPSNYEKHNAYLKERIENNEAIIFVASEDENPDKIIGFALIYVTFSSLALNKILILNDLFVDPSVRKKGIGEKLIAQTEAFAKELGSKTIRLRTAKSNNAAQKLYHKMGFVREDYLYSYDLTVS